MPASDSAGQEGIIGRKVVFCRWLQTFSTEELIQTCPECLAFCLFCCSCSRRGDVRKPCHHYRLVFTDGACRLNGQQGATAGIGFATGLKEVNQVSIPITEMIDEGQKRTSQRAELLAAMAGLDYMVDWDQLNATLAKQRSKELSPVDAEKSWVIATDSEYVVKGMTEWLPAWKENNFRTNRGTKPANLDLFLRLDEALAVEEGKQDVKIGFWHVPREYNTVADRLAKEASLLGDLER